jgi:ATP-dependent Clp protease, protease subunit
MSKSKVSSADVSSFFNEIEKFHQDNIFISSRTIYFGGQDFMFGEGGDVVNSSTVAQLIKNIHILDCMNSQPITIMLNTPGGSWEDGIAVYDIIQKIKSPIIMLGMGKIYSMGSVILQAGDKRYLTKNTSVMIHDGTDGYVGQAKAFESWAKFSKDVRMTMYNIYYERMKIKNPKITLKEIEDLCSHDTIFNSEEAVNVGLADGIM